MWDRLPVFVFATVLAAQELPLGQVIESVTCQQDSSQTYALYVPSNYTADRAWPLLVTFDPRARGLNGVERFQKAAETFGYIVAGSNNSRNGSWETSQKAIVAMFADLPARFHIDEKRLYTGGMSGGARVATSVALGSGKIAGVIAASAGFPDGRPRRNAPFVIFGTAGDEDFNYVEMRDLDKTLSTPHHVSIFKGGHVWLSSGLAFDALEFMELQAMKSGLRAKDEGDIKRAFDRQMTALAAAEGKDALVLASSIVKDFAGLADTAKAAARAEELQSSKPVKEALRKEREDAERERSLLREIYESEGTLKEPDRRQTGLMQLRETLSKLAKQANGEQDSAERRLARRVTRGVAMSLRERKDPDVEKMINELGLAPRFPRQ
ncbi:MAG: hypothetical protein U0Q16_08750 [Bryobacteraceae bacterium]